MSLSLPEDIEQHFTSDHRDYTLPGVYALRLEKPDELPEVWDREYDKRPEFWDQLTESSRVIYVGAAKNVLSRLEDHRDGEVRKAALMRVCSIDSLRNVYWFNTPERAFLKESQVAMMMQNELADTYVHQR